MENIEWIPKFRILVSVNGAYPNTYSEFDNLQEAEQELSRLNDPDSIKALNFSDMRFTLQEDIPF